MLEILKKRSRYFVMYEGKRFTFISESEALAFIDSTLPPATTAEEELSSAVLELSEWNKE